MAEKDSDRPNYAFKRHMMNKTYFSGRKVHVVKQRTIPAFTKARVLVRISTLGLVLIEPGGKLTTR